MRSASCKRSSRRSAPRAGRLVRAAAGQHRGRQVREVTQSRCKGKFPRIAASAVSRLLAREHRRTEHMATSHSLQVATAAPSTSTWRPGSADETPQIATFSRYCARMDPLWPQAEAPPRLAQPMAKASNLTLTSTLTTLSSTST